MMASAEYCRPALLIQYSMPNKPQETTSNWPH
jgi:hypothetical protein